MSEPWSPINEAGQDYLSRKEQERCDKLQEEKVSELDKVELLPEDMLSTLASDTLRDQYLSKGADPLCERRLRFLAQAVLDLIEALRAARQELVQSYSDRNAAVVFRQSERIAELEQQLSEVKDKLRRDQICWTCGGAKHASGIICVCNDSGNHIDEVINMRLEIVRNRERIAELRNLIVDVIANRGTLPDSLYEQLHAALEKEEK